MMDIQSVRPCNFGFENQIENNRTFIEEIEKKNIQAVLDYLDKGGSLNDILEHFYPTSLSSLCFYYFDADQLKQILCRLPDRFELPWDTLRFLVDDEEGEKIEWFKELLPELERLNVDLETLYKRSVYYGNIEWIHFFLTHSVRDVNLNIEFENSRHLSILPLNEMKLKAAQLFAWIEFVKEFKKPLNGECSKSGYLDTLQTMQRMLQGIRELIEMMENHPNVDKETAAREREMYQSSVYFIDDPLLEKDAQIFADSVSLEKLRIHIANGLNLYNSIGPFCVIMEIDSDIRWIDLIAYFYENEADLINLMEESYVETT